jgi:hypothetical protein
MTGARPPEAGAVVSVAGVVAVLLAAGVEFLLYPMKCSK